MAEIPEPEPPPEGSPIEDSLARGEADLLRLVPRVPTLAEKRRLYHGKLFDIRNAFLSGVRIIAFLAPFVVFVMLGVWLDHIIGPQCWRWLKPDEVNHLQTLLFSGAVSALGTAIATKVV